MAQIQKGTTYITGDQVTAANLNALADSAILLPGAITDQTAKTVPLAADTVLIHSAADTALRKSTLTQLFANATGIPISTGISGLGTGIATALAVNTGSAGAPVLFNGALGTPSSGTATNLTGTSGITGTGVLNSGSITSGFGSIDVGADSISGGAGAFTTLSASSTAAVALSATRSNAGTVAQFIGPSQSAYIYTDTNGIYLGSDSAQNTALYLNETSDTITAYTGGAVRGAFSSTGLAVTGALSSTGGANFATSSGSVGIGTASPASKLDTAGTVRATSQTVPSSGTGAELFYDATNAGLRGYNRTGSAYVNLALNDNVYIGGGSSGNVGIGTSSPASKLQVTTSGAAALPPTSGTTPSTGELIRLRTSSDAAGGIGTIGLSTNQMWLQACDATNLGAYYQLLLNPKGGNVGIGTSSPAAKLTVAKSFNISSDGVYAASSASGTGLNFGYDGAGTEQSWIQALRNNTSETRELQLNPLGGTVSTGAALSVGGALSKASGSFRIEHPLPEKSATHQLVHSFIEGPQADLIYRGKVVLVDGKASVNIDAASTMTEGTFEVLCRDVQCFTTNESGWTAVRGKVTGNILTIEAKDSDCTDEISWMVIGERQDPHMMETDWTDDNGKVIVEPLKPSIESN